MVLLRFVALYSLFDTLNIVFSAALRGAGDTRFVMIYLLIMSSCILTIPSILLVGVFHFSVYVAWLIVSAYVILLGFGFLARFLQGRWQSMRVISQSGHEVAP